jgi:hypothetical protein
MKSVYLSINIKGVKSIPGSMSSVVNGYGKSTIKLK